MDTTTFNSAIYAYSFVVGIFMLAVWILIGFAFYNLYKKSNQAHPWLAFIPLANMWPYMWTIKKSAWNLFWLLCPIANVVFSILWMIRLFKAYNINPLWTLLLLGGIIPVIGNLATLGFIILYCYMGFSKDVQYNPDFDRPTPPPSGFVG